MRTASRTGCILLALLSMNATLVGASVAEAGRNQVAETSKLSTSAHDRSLAPLDTSLRVTITSGPDEGSVTPSTIVEFEFSLNRCLSKCGVFEYHQENRHNTP